MTDSTTTAWIKARKSTDNGNCVEMRRHQGGIEIRDTKAHGTGPSLRLAPTEFDAWIDGARNGEFDHLINS